MSEPDPDLDRPQWSPEDLDWSPLRPGGALFGTHEGNLIRVGVGDGDGEEREVFEFGPTRASRVLVYGLGGGALFSVVVGLVAQRVWSDPALVVVGVAAGLALAIIAALLWRMLFNYRLFSRTFVLGEVQGCYWDTREGGDRSGPSASAGRGAAAGTVALSEIAGIQLTRERIETKQGGFVSTELNLVLTGGRRICVLDHGDETRLIADATALAKFLDRPLWGPLDDAGSLPPG